MSVPFCFKPAVPAALVVLISGCAAPVSGPVAFHDTTPRLAQTQVETRASFECGGGSARGTSPDLCQRDAVGAGQATG